MTSVPSVTVTSCRASRARHRAGRAAYNRTFTCALLPAKNAAEDCTTHGSDADFRCILAFRGFRFERQSGLVLTILASAVHAHLVEGERDMRASLHDGPSARRR